MSSSFVTAHNPSSITEIRENANAPIKRELRRTTSSSCIRTGFKQSCEGAMNLPDSWGSHQPEPQLQEVSNRCRNAVESPQNLTSFTVIIIITTCARPSLAIATMGQARHARSLISAASSAEARLKAFDCQRRIQSHTQFQS
jgi:hypothetical protein